MCRPRRRPGRAFRCGSPRGVSSRSIMSARRRGGPRMRNGMRRTGSRSIRMMPEGYGVKDGEWVWLASRAAETDRVAPGVVYTTFHHPLTQANVVTTENSDWATNCPEYKVTAVQVMPTARRPERLPADRII